MLPLRINFNPLLITYCLLLRTLADLAQSAENQGGAEAVAVQCLLMRQTMVSKLYQIQIKAVNTALKNLKMEGVAPEV